MSDTHASRAATPISAEDVNDFEQAFAADPTARLVQNAVTTTTIDAVALDRRVVTSIDRSMSDQLDFWPVANQKHSGRCWLFAGLNFLKQHVIAETNLKEFEFSQNYMSFWDKLEKANWFLTAMVELADRPLDDRLLARMLADPMSDGGQWDMFVALVQKYGVVPKYAMPETESSSNTQAMNRNLRSFLRYGAKQLREVPAGQDADALLKELVGQAYRILSIHLGTPPKDFIWQWRDKDKQFHRGGLMTPQSFAKEILDVDVTDFVAVVNDPRPSSPYGSTLTVDHLGNVVGGRPICYLNVEASVLKDLVKSRILDGHVVWFSCDVSQQFERNEGLWDARLMDYEGAYGVDYPMDKVARIEYGSSAMTHAMVLTGVDIVDGRPRRFRVENSWGDERSDKGFDTMNDSWFDQYVFEAAIPRSALPADLLAALAKAPIVLPLWDPMGELLS